MKTAMKYTIITMLLPLLSTAALIDPTYDSLIAELIQMNTLNLGSSLLLDLGASSATNVAAMQGDITQSCNGIATAITDAGASFTGAQCTRARDLFGTSAAHAMDLLNKVDGLAKGEKLSGGDAQTLDRVFEGQGTACDKAAAMIDGACPKSAQFNTAATQSNVDNELQITEDDLKVNAQKKRRA